MTLVYIPSNVGRGKQVFSLTATVVEMVKRRGQATVDDLQPELPSFTRDQLIAALRNATFRGALICDGYVAGPRGRLPATYRARQKPDKKDEPVTHSMSHAVASAVVAGATNLDKLQEVFPRYHRADLQKALAAASLRGYIRVQRKGKRGKPTEWREGYVPLHAAPRVASVWELADPRPDTAWPKEPAVRQIHRPLGDWVTEEATA